MIKTAQDVLDFWFDSGNDKWWFEQNNEFDDKIRDQFGDTWQAASEGRLYDWRTTSKGRLAEIIVLDQFSRNLHRGTPLAFSQDLAALILAQELINDPEFQGFSMIEKNFAYLPFMHSESPEVHEVALDLFKDLGNEEVLEIEQQHKYIIDRFGRYPHRNEALGRESTPEELDFLMQPNSSF